MLLHFMSLLSSLLANIHTFFIHPQWIFSQFQLQKECPYCSSWKKYALRDNRVLKEKKSFSRRYQYRGYNWSVICLVGVFQWWFRDLLYAQDLDVWHQCKGFKSLLIELTAKGGSSIPLIEVYILGFWFCMLNSPLPKGYELPHILQHE